MSAETRKSPKNGAQNALYFTFIGVFLFKMQQKFDFRNKLFLVPSLI